MRYIIAIILMILGVMSVCFAEIMQCVICVQMYGVVFKQVFIPHWSAWFFLGVIPMLVAHILAKD